MTFDKIIEAVTPYVNKSVYDIVRLLHIDIVRDDSMLFGNYARLVWLQDTTIILLKENLDDQQETVYLLHEIAHYLLHHNTFSIDKNCRRLEKEADMFVCLYLTQLDDTCSMYYHYLINCGISPVVASSFDDAVYQYRQSTRFCSYWQFLEC